MVASALLLSSAVSSRAQKWERLGPEGGMVVSMATDQGANVYLGTPDGHVFASSDGAHSWEMRGRVGTRLDAVVTRIVADPRAKNRLFAAVWYQDPAAGGGVFASEDGGKTWKLIGLEGEAVRALEIAPSQPAELVAGTRSGVFRSSDGGKNWNRISPQGDEEIRNLDSLAIDPRDPKVIYAGTFHLPWLTRDGGKNWKPVIAGIIDDSDIMSLRLDVTNPSRVYMSACSGIYRSENQGGEWIKLQGIPYAARRTQVIVQDPASPKTLYAGTTEGLWVTRDGGENWTRTTSRDWAVNSVVILDGKSGKPGRVVLGTDGLGVEASEDGGVTFTEANHGFTHAVVRQLVADRHSPGNLLMIVERSGSELQESRDDGKSWTSVALATTEQRKANSLNANEMREALASPWGWLLSMASGQLWLWDESKSAWKPWKLIFSETARRAAKADHARTPASQPAREIVPGAMASSEKEMLVSTAEGLMRCPQSGNCARVKAFGRGKMRALWVSGDGHEIAAVADGKLGTSMDRGETATWRDLPENAEHLVWLDVAEPDDGKKIYLSTDKGVFWSSAEDSSWHPMEGGLPAGRVEESLRRPELWVVSERNAGLYVSRDHGVTWKRVDRDPERGEFTGLVGTASGAILAGSQSEGLLRLQP